MFALAHRYWGVEAQNLDVTLRHARHGYKCVNWLTIIGNPLRQSDPKAVERAQGCRLGRRGNTTRNIASGGGAAATRSTGTASEPTAGRYVDRGRGPAPAPGDGTSSLSAANAGTRTTACATSAGSPTRMRSDPPMGSPVIPECFPDTPRRPRSSGSSAPGGCSTAIHPQYADRTRSARGSAPRRAPRRGRDRRVHGTRPVPGVPEPGEAFTAAHLAFEAAKTDTIQALLEAAEPNPSLVRGIVSAVGWLTDDAAAVAIPMLHAWGTPIALRIGLARGHPTDADSRASTGRWPSRSGMPSRGRSRPSGRWGIPGGSPQPGNT